MGLCQSKQDVSNPTIQPTKETVNQVQIDQGISVKTNGEYLFLGSGMKYFSFVILKEPFVTWSCSEVKVYILLFLLS